MSESSMPPSLPSDPQLDSSVSGNIVVITSREFHWLTLGLWIGGIFILTLMPLLLIPRLGMPLGVGCSYLLFFFIWQPIQSITQRTVGTGAGVIRMVLFVAAAATIAFYLREALLGMSR